MFGNPNMLQRRRFGNPAPFRERSVQTLPPGCWRHSTKGSSARFARNQIGNALRVGIPQSEPPHLLPKCRASDAEQF